MPFENATLQPFEVSACFSPSVLLVKPLGAVVVMCGISGGCERVRAENISPSFWGCQGLDKSCLNFTLCKMPCVNSCPWPECSDLVRQTPGAAHPSPWDLCWQWARIHPCSQTGLYVIQIFKDWQTNGGTNSGSIRKESSDSSPKGFSQFSPLQSSAMSGAAGTSCGKSQTGVMQVVSGWSHLCLL